MDENEVKIVLRDPITLEAQLEELFARYHSDQIAEPGIDCELITQGYLNPSNRLRQIESRFRKTEWWLTYKQRLANHHNLEIEGQIEHDAYQYGWQFTKERLIKCRYKLFVDPCNWDIDFYRWSIPYFALAEVEMPADSDAWEAPDALKPFLHHVVPRDDTRFTARLLADETHVAMLAKELGLSP